MRRNLFPVIVLFAGALAGGLLSRVLPAFAATPTAAATDLIPFHAHLERDASPYTQEVALTLTIYDDPSAGTPKYAETFPKVAPSTDGDFTVTLGVSGVNPLNNLPLKLSSVLASNNGALYVSISVDDGSGAVVLNGRQRLLSAPYATNGVPPGAVMFFNLSACPSGWQTMTQAQGRTLVGMQPSGTLGFAVGNAFADKEARAHSHLVNDHAHSVGNTTGTYLFGGITWYGNGGLVSNSQGLLGVDTDCCGQILGQQHYHTVGPTSTASGLTTLPTNDVVPYLQLLACQKD
jgi:hypothetical protein